ncbi:MAG: asparagine synthase (glutamine-hydrolyzing) [Bacteroidales bacterium]
MCGIAGIIDFGGTAGRERTVESMLRSISYRGPDESGIYNSPHATIGNVRLSIIDIASGQQPLADESGRYWIVFNGEIFNYKELRHDIESKGCRFATNSDTEVLVQLYAMYGSKCLSMLNGQFAVAIWDKVEEKLFIARDRVGIRPVFYNLTGNVLTFGSEIKAVFKNSSINPELSPESLSQVYTYWTAITPNTVFKNVRELSPGHYMTFSRQGLKIEKFWDITYTEKNHSISLPDAVERFDELFSDAVRIRLRADVEVAAYLSGGIDSSTTVSYIKNIEPGILNTFSIGFDEADFDETAYQNEAARYLDTNHKAIKCTSKEIAESIPRVVWHSETPMTRTAPAPMLLLSKLVRENNIKVVITGEGADEILSGYDIFKEDKIRRFWATQPNSKIRPLLLKKLYPYLPQMKDANPAILKMFYGYKLEDTGNLFYSHLLRWNNSNHIKKHFSADVSARLEGYSPFTDLEQRLPEGFEKWSDLVRAQWLETTVFMSGYLLSSQGDRMAMGNSVEGRYPFLDYRVIEFCMSLPDRFKLNGLTEKFLLKKVMNGKIPESIVKRSKQAYRAPIRSVFVSNEAPGYVKEMLSDSFTKKAGIFNPDSVSALVSKIEKSGTSTEVDNMVLTAVVSTHLLFKQFIERNEEGLPQSELSNLRIIDDFPGKS